MPRLLITGASGLLGGHLLHQARPGWQVLPLCHQHPMNDPAARPLDLKRSIELEASIEQFRPDVIIHAAANANLDDCERNREAATAVNADATATLARCARAVHARLIFISTDMVFDGLAGDYRETDPPRPISHYGATKMLAEQATAATIENHVIVRSALIYGRSIEGGHSFSQWMEDRLKKGDPVPLYFDQYRTPILVANLAEAILELAAGSFTGILHLGGDRIDRYTFGEQLCRLAGYPVRLLQKVSMDRDHGAAPRPRDVSLNTELARSLLHTPLLSVAEGLKRMLEC